MVHVHHKHIVMLVAVQIHKVLSAVIALSYLWQWNFTGILSYYYQTEADLTFCFRRLSNTMTPSAQYVTMITTSLW